MSGQAAGLTECFEQVPAVFFSRDFQLQDPALFEELIVHASPDTQDRLTHYLDVVETCLLKQISSRSQQFFEALTNLQVGVPPSPIDAAGRDEGGSC
jgi:hypothetical protein